MEYRVARALELVARTHDCALVGVPMQAKHDEEILKRVFAMINIPRPSLVLDWTEHFEELFGTIQISRALLAMRLHACLLGHRLGVPTLGITYDPKVEQHFKELGIEERALSYSATVDDLVAGLTQVLALEGKLETRVYQRVVSLEKATRDGIRSLAAVLGEAPVICGAPPIRTTGIDSKTNTEVRVERDYLRVKRELELVKDSVSYQLGAAIVQALCKPGYSTVLLPYRLLRLILRGVNRITRA